MYGFRSQFEIRERFFFVGKGARSCIQPSARNTGIPFVGWNKRVPAGSKQFIQELPSAMLGKGPETIEEAGFCCRSKHFDFKVRFSAKWNIHIYILYIYISSTAQGGGRSFKNRKPIGEVGCCESGMADRSHWWTERCLRSPVFLSLSLFFSLFLYLSLIIYLPAYLLIYLSTYLSVCLSIYLPTYLFIYPSTYLPTYLSICLSIYLSISLSLSLSLFHLSISLAVYLIYLSICLSVYLSTCLSVVQCHSV